MLEVPPQPVTRRNLLDGGYTVALLALAIVVGYGTLASSAAPAVSAAKPRSAVSVGAVITPSAEPLAGATPTPLASIPDTMRAPAPPKPAETTVAIARPPAVA